MSYFPFFYVKTYTDPNNVNMKRQLIFTAMIMTAGMVLAQTTDTVSQAMLIDTVALKYFHAQCDNLHFCAFNKGKRHET